MKKILDNNELKNCTGGQTVREFLFITLTGILGFTDTAANAILDADPVEFSVATTIILSQSGVHPPVP